LGGAPASALGQACTPFGNPPQAFIANVVPKCSGGKLLGPWNDSAGTPRYACLYLPSKASSSPLPLVVYLHPSLADADSIGITNLLKTINTANVSDNPQNPGFILLAPEGRNTTHLYPSFDSKGPGWDNWYRQISPSGEVTVGGTTYAENVDAATIDHFIDLETATGKVDPNRIFVTGWSNGAAMAFLYGLSRPNIAAIAPYSAPNPFGAFNDPCQQTPVAGAPGGNSQLQIFNPGLPTDHLHNNCDIAGICPNGELMESELLPLGVFVQDTIMDAMQEPANGCDFTCGTNPDGDPNNVKGDTVGARNHTRWPTTWNLAILDFFRRHPLSARAN
jgi:dienelactone hydrolase